MPPPHRGCVALRDVVCSSRPALRGREAGADSGERGCRTRADRDSVRIINPAQHWDGDRCVFSPASGRSVPAQEKLHGKFEAGGRRTASPLRPPLPASTRPGSSGSATGAGSGEGRASAAVGRRHRAPRERRAGVPGGAGIAAAGCGRGGGGAPPRLSSPRLAWPLAAAEGRRCLPALPRPAPLLRLREGRGEPLVAPRRGGGVGAGGGSSVRCRVSPRGSAGEKGREWPRLRLAPWAPGSGARRTGTLRSPSEPGDVPAPGGNILEIARSGPRRTSGGTPFHQLRGGRPAVVYRQVSAPSLSLMFFNYYLFIYFPPGFYLRLEWLLLAAVGCLRRSSVSRRVGVGWAGLQGSAVPHPSGTRCAAVLGEHCVRGARVQLQQMVTYRNWCEIPFPLCWAVNPL